VAAGNAINFNNFSGREARLGKNSMKPEPDFGTDGLNLMLPEVQMWRAVLFRAVLDAQHGSQAMMRDVLRWIDTKDFERVLVWAGFELEQGRRAAKYLRDVCAERSAESAKSGSLSAVEQPELDVSEDESELFDESLLALICTAREISQSKRAACPRPQRRRSFRVGASMAGSSPAA
jgi:hypothetical protein